MCARNVVFDAVADLTMIAEVIDGLQRHGVYGVRANQFLSVKHIAIGWILGAGAGPERTLDMCTCMLERLEARRAEDALKVVVHQAGIGDSCFALQRLEF